jgi:hypothetical protein
MKTIELYLLAFALEQTLRLAGFFARAVGRRLPGVITTFVPPAIDPADMPGDNLYGCTAWRYPDEHYRTWERY